MKNLVFHLIFFISVAVSLSLGQNNPYDVEGENPPELSHFRSMPLPIPPQTYSLSTSIDSATNRLVINIVPRQGRNVMVSSSISDRVVVITLGKTSNNKTRGIYLPKFDEFDLYLTQTDSSALYLSLKDTAHYRIERHTEDSLFVYEIKKCGFIELEQKVFLELAKNSFLWQGNLDKE